MVNCFIKWLKPYGYYVEDGVNKVQIARIEFFSVDGKMITMDLDDVKHTFFLRTLADDVKVYKRKQGMPVKLKDNLIYIIPKDGVNVLYIPIHCVKLKFNGWKKEDVSDGIGERTFESYTIEASMFNDGNGTYDLEFNTNYKFEYTKYGKKLFKLSDDIISDCCVRISPYDLHAILKSYKITKKRKKS